MNQAYFLVRRINEMDLEHRQGWKSSDRSLLDTVEDLVSEAQELDTAVVLDMVSQKEELADVLACVLQAAYRMGLSVNQLEEETVRKLRLRFHGAEAIEV